MYKFVYESLRIELSTNLVNVKTDTEDIDNIYNNLILLHSTNNNNTNNSNKNNNSNVKKQI